jgi:hypothetical protein
MTKVQQDLTAQQAKAKEEATKTVEDARARALLEREKIINQAVETRDKMRQEVMAEMEEKAIFHSKDLISEFFSGDLRKIVHETLISEAIEGLKGLPVENFQISSGAAEVKVAQALTADEKQKLQKAIKAKINKEVTLHEEVDASLVGGLVLKFGTFVIDGSLINRLKESASRLKKETARRYQSST